MDDRALLELAARAVNLAYFDIDEVGVIEYGADTSSGFRHWNPLTDDGDALRLAVKLRMMVDVGGGGFCTADLTNIESSVNESATPNPYAATRRAIVRAAAEIGKMKGEK